LNIVINAKKARELHDRLSSQVLNNLCGDKITRAIIKNRNTLRIFFNNTMPQPGSELYEMEDEYRRRIKDTFEEFAQKDDNGKVIGNVPAEKNGEFREAMEAVDEVYKEHLAKMKELKEAPLNIPIMMLYKKDLPKTISLEQRELLLFMIEGEHDMDPIFEED